MRRAVEGTMTAEDKTMTDRNDVALAAWTKKVKTMKAWAVAWAKTAEVKALEKALAIAKTAEDEAGKAARAEEEADDEDHENDGVIGAGS